MEEITFEEYGKTPRFFRNMIVTEKLDGTNAAILVTDDGRVGAQSRNRLITPGKATDNYGFARWVEDNAVALAEVLGAGRHFGEWWGGGIARNYGLEKSDKRFSLFHVDKYGSRDLARVPGLGTVPVLSRYTMDSDVISNTIADLRENGSKAVPGFMNPEGVIVWHSASKNVYKVLLENDELPKGLVNA